jgi:vitamin B12 transporter
MQKRPIFHIFLLLSGVVRGAQAAADTSLDRSPDAARLEVIEVTASRVAETADASLAEVSVLTRADIEASGAPDLLELLRLEAGVDVARTGGPGAQTSVFLRGTNSNHVLVLIDGVRVASANTGAFAFENLPLEAIERIEIVRGPRASYWGSDAIGGVIQVFTRRLHGPSIAASYGSYRSADGSVGLGAASEQADFTLQLGARHVGGFSATNPGVCTGANDPYCIYNPDPNGFQNHDLVAAGAYRMGTQTLSASVFRSVGTQSFDNGAEDGISHTLDQALGVTLQGALGATWQQRLSLGSAREDLDTPAFGSAFRSTREQLSWTHEFAPSVTQHLVAGFDYLHERGVSEDRTGYGAPYDVARHEGGVFAGYQTQRDALDGEIAARYDHYDSFGGAWSGQAAIGWQAAAGVRLTASLGNAFRAPSLSELYSPGYGGYYAGNPDLRPERSRTAELGVDWRIAAAQRFSAHAFATRVHDLIDFSGGSTFQAINVERAAIDGIDLEHRWYPGAFSLTTEVTVQNPRNLDRDAQLLRRPRRKLASVLERAFGDAWTGGVEFFASSRRDDVGAHRLPGYGLVNLRLSYRPSPTWRVSLRLENLTDRFYELAHGYNTPGRSVNLEAAWQAQ